MIEFKGYLTGAAEKGFVRKGRKIALIGWTIVLMLAAPVILFISIVIVRDISFFYIMLASLFIGTVIIFIPKGKKEHFSMLPKRIYIRDDHIVCVADQYTESKFVDDVTKVIDHGEYYELCFPFGKISSKFICQKSLLTKGSIRQFEALFDGKIVRKA